MTKIVARIIIVMLFVCCKPLIAQNATTFQEVHTQLLDDYVLFIDSVEKKHPHMKPIDIFKHRHVSKVEFHGEHFVYHIRKRVKVYKTGIRYEKIDWFIKYHHSFWKHRIYEIKQIGQNYRFIEQIDYEYGRKLKQAKITTSFDDNYILIRTLRPKEKRGSRFLVKPTSGLPGVHQD